MVAVCEFAEQISAHSNHDSANYNIFAPGDAAYEVENYLLVSIDDIGFVVIRQTIEVGDK